MTQDHDRSLQHRPARAAGAADSEEACGEKKDSKSKIFIPWAFSGGPFPLDLGRDLGARCSRSPNNQSPQGQQRSREAPGAPPHTHRAPEQPTAAPGTSLPPAGCDPPPHTHRGHPNPHQPPQNPGEADRAGVPAAGRVSPGGAGKPGRALLCSVETPGEAPERRRGGCVWGGTSVPPPLPVSPPGRAGASHPPPPPPRAAPGSPPCPDAPAPCWARARPTGRAACCRRGCPEGLRFGLGAETRAGHRLPGPGRAGSGGAGPGQGRGQVGGAGRLRPLGCGVGGGGLGVPFGRSSPSLWWV